MKFQRKKVILLTTWTTHHSYFINQISKYSNLFVVYEKNKLIPKFQTKHHYEVDQVRYEKKIWFQEKKFSMKKKNKICVKNINEKKVINYIKRINPDIIFSFGISRLNENFLSSIKKKIYNFHGGDSKFYRGLDSHLWALYHNDYLGLKVTLHEVDKSLDTGKIIYKKKINLDGLEKLSQLRSKNTEVCVELAFKLLKNYPNIKNRSVSTGKYYSYMPKVLKSIIYENFQTKIKKILKNDKKFKRS